MKRNEMQRTAPLFVLSLALVTKVIGVRVETEDEKGIGMVARSSLSTLSVQRASSAVRSADKVLQTFAQRYGMLPQTFSEEWPLVARVYNEYCCLSEPPELPDGGRDVSLFLVDYGKLPSLAVLVDNRIQTKVSLAVVYRSGANIGELTLGILEKPEDSEVKPDIPFSLPSSGVDAGIFMIEDEDEEEDEGVSIYVTAKALQASNAYDKFKALGKIDDSTFHDQAFKLGMIATVDLESRLFHVTSGIADMLDLPDNQPLDSLVVADPSALQHGERSLAILFRNDQIVPAMLSQAALHDNNQRWKVFVRYIPDAQGDVHVLSEEVTCRLFGPDLHPVLLPPPPDNALADTFIRGLKPSSDPFHQAAIAAARRRMPNLPINNFFFNEKYKTLPLGSGPPFFVLYHHAQRKQAYARHRIFEHVFAGDATGAVSFASFSSVMQQITKPAAMTFILSDQRFAMGWALDGVEVGTGHNCLISDMEEEVYIAGEILFEEAGIQFNFLSGTFTRQISPLYFAGPDAHETQWAGLIKALLHAGWYSQSEKTLHGKPNDMPIPKVTWTPEKVLIPMRAPVPDTIAAFCHSEPWMQSCFCIADSPDLYVNYCEQLKGAPATECNHQNCHP